MQSITNAHIQIAGKKVGTLALYDGVAAFEYSSDWLTQGFSISPLSLPLQTGVFMPKHHPFDGVFGIFSDSLPDGWGRLLLDRLLRSLGENPEVLGPLQRLCIVGSMGMGALEYIPELHLEGAAECADFDQLASECAKVLAEQEPDDLDRLFRMGGSSGGARPKVFATIGGQPWIVKFRSSLDAKNTGKMEYDYVCCASECGIEVPRVALLPSEQCAGYFAVQRFDRKCQPNGTQRRIHMASVSALLETSHRVPNLDYKQLMKLTAVLTRNNIAELKKMFRLMCFNVFAHNRDDHSKNFSFLYDDVKSEWSLSPAYDLTYSSSLAGQHATMVAGNGENPGIADIMRVVQSTDLDAGWARDTAQFIHDVVAQQLEEYLRAC